MGAADTVKARIFVQLHAAVFTVVERRRAKYAVIMVDAAAFYLDAFAVQQKSIFRVNSNGAYTEERGIAVGKAAGRAAGMVKKFRLHGVEIGIVDVPEGGIFYHHA